MPSARDGAYMPPIVSWTPEGTLRRAGAFELRIMTLMWWRRAPPTATGAAAEPLQASEVIGRGAARLCAEITRKERGAGSVFVSYSVHYVNDANAGNRRQPGSSRRWPGVRCPERQWPCSTSWVGMNPSAIIANIPSSLAAWANCSRKIARFRKHVIVSSRVPNVCLWMPKRHHQ